MRPHSAREHAGPCLNDQSRILVGTNRRMIISLMTYRLKHAGEDSPAIESREGAGIVTYERTSVLHMASAQPVRISGDSNLDAPSEPEN